MFVRGVGGVGEVVRPLDEGSEGAGERAAADGVGAAARARRPHLRRQAPQRPQRRSCFPLRSLQTPREMSPNNPNKHKHAFIIHESCHCLTQYDTGE